VLPAEVTFPSLPRPIIKAGTQFTGCNAELTYSWLDCIPSWYTCPKMVTLRSTNGAQRKVSKVIYCDASHESFEFVTWLNACRILARGFAERKHYKHVASYESTTWTARLASVYNCSGRLLMHATRQR